jgi:hypothetical protein
MPLSLMEPHHENAVKEPDASEESSSSAGGLPASAPMNSFPICRGCTRHTTKRFGEVALISKTVLYSDVGERVTAVQ